MMYTQHPTHRLERALLLVILLVAAVLRFASLMQIEHNLDHAYPVWQALQTIEHGAFPIVGQGTSVLFANPALTGYLYIPFILLTHSLIAIYVFVIALNTLAVYLTYRAARRIIGWKWALMAIALMAVNPWVIEYSRTTWPPALMAFFTAASAWLLWPILLGVAKHPGRRTILAAIIITLMTQTTLIAYFVLVPVAVLVFLYRKRFPFRPLMIGLGIFVAVQAVYAVGLLAQWQTVQDRVQGFAADSSQGSRLREDALLHAFRLVTGDDYELVRGLQAPADDANQRAQLSDFATNAAALALTGGAALATLALIRPLGTIYPPDTDNKQAREGAFILLVWFGLPILAMSYNASPVHPYYLLVTLPAGYVLAAWGLGALFQPHRLRTGAAFVAILLAVYGLLMGVNSTRYYQETAAIPGAHGTGALPLDVGMELGRIIDDNLLNGAVVFADEEEWTLNSFAMRTFPVIRDTRAPDVTIVPQTGGLYIVANPPLEVNFFVPLYARPLDDVNLRDGWQISIDQFPPGGASFCTADTLIPAERWLSFARYTLSRQGRTVTLTTDWHVEALTPEIDGYNFAPFVHVFDANGERVLIVDGKAIPGTRWHTGDLHIHRIQFALPRDVEGPFTLQIGQFDGVRNEALTFILPDGTYSQTIPLDEIVD